MRDRSVDLQRGILVVLMLYAHLLQFFGDLQRFPSIHFWVMGISLLAFPAFVFCFGRTAALAYLKKPFRQALPRMGRTFGRCLAAFYVSGAAFRVLREHRPLEAETLRGILLFSDIPGWSEFLIAFALLMLSAILLFPLLRQLARRRWLWLPLSLPCALCCFLPYDRVTLPQLALLIGGKNLVTYPIVQYFPFFLAGVAYADASFRERLGMGGAALAFSAAGLVRYVRHGLPEQFSRPTGRGSFPALLRHRPADGALPRPVPSARRKILAARGRSAAVRCPISAARRYTIWLAAIWRCLRWREPGSRPC